MIFLGFLVVLAACQSAPPTAEGAAPPTAAPATAAPATAAPASAAPATAAPALPQPGEPAEGPCVRDCLEQSQMQARAWEAIVADCRHLCAEKKTP